MFDAMVGFSNGLKGPKDMSVISPLAIWSLMFFQASKVQARFNISIKDAFPTMNSGIVNECVGCYVEIDLMLIYSTKSINFVPQLYNDIA